MLPQAFIFIGRSGCGKGTQKDLLQKVLSERGATSLQAYTGDALRELATGKSFVSSKVRKILDGGGLMPSFVASAMWAKIVMEKYEEGQNLIFDGSPRTMNEAKEMEGAFQFLGFTRPAAVYINVSNEWAKERLLGRGREDDSEYRINQRLSWFDTAVAPLIEYYRTNDFYQFVEVKGEQTVEEVHRDILSGLNLPS